MMKRKLLIGLIAAGTFAATLGGSVMPASADPRTLLVTLVGGQQLTVTVDVSPGTPLDQIKIPGVTQPIASVQDVTPKTNPAPQPPAQGQPAPAPGPTPSPQAPAAGKAATGTTPAPTKTGNPPAKDQTSSTGKSALEQAAAAARRRRERDAAKAKAVADAKRKAKARDAAKAKTEAKAKAEAKRKAKAKREADKRKAEAERKAKAERDAAAKAKAKARAEANAHADAAPQPAATATPAPADTQAGLGVGLPSPPPIGVPNFFIESFRIPPFLLPIYQAAGIEYGVRWEILAAINEIETDYGRNLNVSTAGAVGWMQFLPSTWARYGVDANRDGRKDPYNPVDAVFAAARYLKAARADQDVRAAIFAYNHADWYVNSVLMRARLIGSLPPDLVGALTGLTQGHFPVFAKRVRYAGGERRARAAQGTNPAVAVDASAARTSIDVFAKAGAPVVAVQDGRVVRMGTSKRLGRYVRLRDVFGNTYTYGGLKALATAYPVPKDRTVSDRQVRAELRLPKADPRPTAPATAGRQRANAVAGHTRRAAKRRVPTVRKQRLFANPLRPRSYAAGGRKQVRRAPDALGPHGLKAYFTQSYGLGPRDVELKPMRPGAKVIAGTVLGRIGSVQAQVKPHVRFEVRPAGRGAPLIDPKPILDGWKLLGSTAIYRAAGASALGGPVGDPSIGQILLMSKESLQQRVLADDRITIYACGRRDIRAGEIDRRVLATLEFLASSGLKPTVTSLHCGHGYFTSSGNVSEHSSGNAVDIAAINGTPILGHQGPGSITDVTIRRLLTLQGTMKPHQIISLMTFEGADNTLSLPDHADHIHVGFRPLFGTNAKLGAQLDAILKPGQWAKLMDRLGQIENPAVPTTPSKYAIKVDTPTAQAHGGD
jgi:soluble lytic murein transglycosylase-like protein